jgi:radical SAM superfamily enzyme YgiQ (UPF0313 family)
MKVMISYPPLKTEKGRPTLGQNRQFQYFKEPTYIYPVAPAQAATLLKQNGFDVLWIDGIAQGLNYHQFKKIVQKEKPDLIAFETKTPVIKQHWKIIDDLKKLSTKDYQLLTVLFGDHVTALPEESFENSKVDFILTGGDYDFLLLNLCQVLRESNLSTMPVHRSLDEGGNYQLSTKLEHGIYYRENGKIKNTGKFQLNHDLADLPSIDRNLTKWKLYAYKNGNYKYLPGTYIMSGRDCWHNACSFCSWTTLYPKFRTRPVNKVLDEISNLISRYRIREIMDDTGTFPVGDWLIEFCQGMIKNEFNKKIKIDCNMRFNALNFYQYRLMAKAGFRLLLFGLESANQKTLDRINKKLKVEEIIKSCKLARSAGLFPHITIMFGYPWETYEDALKTLRLGTWLLKKGYAYTAQATVVIPYPGTPLFEECKEKNLLKTFNWDRYDMKEPVMKISFPPSLLMEMVQGIYKVSFSPRFLLNRTRILLDIDEVKYAFRAGKKVFGHIFDFERLR